MLYRLIPTACPKVEYQFCYLLWYNREGEKDKLQILII